jgi:hypothetical protein
VKYLPLPLAFFFFFFFKQISVEPKVKIVRSVVGSAAVRPQEAAGECTHVTFGRMCFITAALLLSSGPFPQWQTNRHGRLDKLLLLPFNLSE